MWNLQNVKSIQKGSNLFQIKILVKSVGQTWKHQSHLALLWSASRWLDSLESHPSHPSGNAHFQAEINAFVRVTCRQNCTWTLLTHLPSGSKVARVPSQREGEETQIWRQLKRWNQSLELIYEQSGRTEKCWTIRSSVLEYVWLYDFPLNSFDC